MLRYLGYLGLSLVLIGIVIFTWGYYRGADERAYECLAEHGYREVTLNWTVAPLECFPYKAIAFDFESADGSGTVCCAVHGCWIP